MRFLELVEQDVCTFATNILHTRLLREVTQVKVKLYTKLTTPRLQTVDLAKGTGNVLAARGGLRVDDVIRVRLTLLEAQVGHLADGRPTTLHEDKQLIQEQLLLGVGKPRPLAAHLHVIHHVFLEHTHTPRKHTNITQMHTHTPQTQTGTHSANAQRT